MSRKRSIAVSEGNGPVPQDESGSGEPTMVEVFQMLKRGLKKMDNHVDRINKHVEGFTGEIKNSSKRLYILMRQVQQPRLAAKADVKQSLKNRAREEDAAEDEKFGDISSVEVEVDNDPMSQTSFSDREFAQPSAPAKCSDDALVDQVTKAPKSCLMRMPTPTAGLLHVPPCFYNAGVRISSSTSSLGVKTKEVVS